MNILSQFYFWIDLLSFLFSAAIGVIFCLLPVRRVAGLNTIGALHHE